MSSVNLGTALKLLLAYGDFKRKCEEFVTQAETVAGVINQKDVTQFVQQLREVFNSLP